MNQPNLRLPLTTFVAFCAAAGLSACGTPDGAAFEVTQGRVVRNVTVVNTQDGSLRPHTTIVVDGGQIKRLITGAKVHASGSAVAIDGTGKFVVPGYLDMHTHALPAADRTPSHWPALIANGITGVREMAGSETLIQRARKLNEDSAAGRVDAPEILQVPGELFVGRIQAPDAAVAEVQKQKAQGASFIKIVNANRAVTLAVLAEAKTSHLGVAGHLPLALSATDAANAGWRAVEHFGAGMGVLLDCAADPGAIRSALFRGEGAKPVLLPTAVVSPMLYRAADAPFYQRIMQTLDNASCDATAQAFAQNGTWQVPTLIRLRTMYMSDAAEYRNDPNLKYVDKTTRMLWQKLGAQYAAEVPAPAAEIFRSFYLAQRNLVGTMKRSKVPMLAGSDLGGIWVLPGFGLHQEFRELAAAGLTPLEVLQATTLNGAKFLGRESTMGTVDEGKRADLVLLDADPTRHVSNLGRIAAVVLHGKLFTREAIQTMMADLAQAYEDQPLKNLSAAFDPAHLH